LLARRLFAAAFIALMLLGLAASVVSSLREEVLSMTPRNNAAITDRRPKISIRIENPANVDAATIVMFVNDTQVAHSWDGTLGEVSYSPPFDLRLGLNTVEVRAKDTAGKEFTWNWSFTVATAQWLPPVIETTVDGLPLTTFVGLMAAAAAAIAILVAVAGRVR